MYKSRSLLFTVPCRDRSTASQWRAVNLATSKRLSFFGSQQKNYSTIRLQIKQPVRETRPRPSSADSLSTRIHRKTASPERNRELPTSRLRILGRSSFIHARGLSPTQLSNPSAVALIRLGASFSATANGRGIGRAQCPPFHP